MTSRARLLDLLRTRSFEQRRVTLASGRESDFFIDCKQAVLTALGHTLAGELLFDALGELPRCDAIAGVELGGCPLASAVSLVSQLRGDPRDALYIRKEAKNHGSKRLVEGDKSLVPDMRVVVLEDVVTTGQSTLHAVETLRVAGARVVGVLSLIDRLEGGADAIRDAGLPIVSLFTRVDFIPKA
jgi:orotate phosphoribosyltransferase